MKKSDLKDGMWVKFRNGGLSMVVGDILLSENGFMRLEDYDSDLMCGYGKRIGSIDYDFDIVNVYCSVPSGVGFNGAVSYINSGKIKPTWIGNDVIKKFYLFSKKDGSILAQVNEREAYGSRNYDNDATIIMFCNGEFSVL